MRTRSSCSTLAASSRSAATPNSSRATGTTRRCGGCSRPRSRSWPPPSEATAARPRARIAMRESAMPAHALTLTRPDDWHVHLRDGAAMAAVLSATARQFARAIVMPNLKPPVVTTAQALAYRERIVAARPERSTFTPLMTLYLTDQTPPDEVRRAKAAGIVAFKLYPAGATTHSDAGVTDLRKTHTTLEAMQREGVLLLVHGEVT